MKTLRLNWSPNPIIVKELRSRMRGPRAFLTLTGVLALLAAISYAIYRMVLVSSRYTTSPLSPQVGQALFSGLAFLELMMICAVTPSVTAGAISGEQEKQTYEMLLATPLRPASILWGKLVSALGYVFLLLFASVPMASLVFIFGGVSPRDMLKALMVLVVVMLMLGVVGLFMSALFGRTGRATALSYLVVLGLLFAPLFISIAAGVMRQAEPPRWITVASPIAALFSAIQPSIATDSMTNLFWMLGGSLWSVMQAPVSQTGIPRPLYHYSLPLYGAVTVLLYLLSTRLVLPARRWRLTLKEGLVGLGVVLGFAALIALAFLRTSGRYENSLSLFQSPTQVPVMGGMVEPPAIMQAPAIPVDAPTATPLPYPVPGDTPAPTATPAALEPGTAFPDPGLNARPVEDSLTEDDQAAIYAAVVRQLYTVDHTFGDQPPNFPVVYLVRSTDDSAGDPGIEKKDSQVIPESVQAAVTKALSDLPAKIIWVDEPEDVPVDPNTGMVEGKGVRITLGNIHQGETTASGNKPLLVSGSLYFANLGAGGKTYFVERIDDEWRITGTTGVEWIS